VIDLAQWGIAVGHATDEAGVTGLTVVRGIDAPFRGGVTVFGRGPGTRELHTLSPDHIVGRADAIMLTGGSAYGLDAAAGIMRWMEERGRGYPVGAGVVPIVPAAVVFDLAPLGSFAARPTPEMAYAACESATSRDIAEGSVGAGTGTTIGKITGREKAMKGGVGIAASRGEGVAVAALAVVNALGDVRDAHGRIIAGARGAHGEWVDSAAALARGVPPASRMGTTVDGAGRNTTLCVVMADVLLPKLELQQLARAAGAALYRRITPTGTTYDGDVVFAISAPGARPPVPPVSSLNIETLAVVALEEAIERAVRNARGRDGIPGLADRP
jgi:L-aminopeptidase/D-esterase-like protein